MKRKKVIMANEVSIIGEFFGTPPFCGCVSQKGTHYLIRLRDGRFFQTFDGFPVLVDKMIPDSCYNEEIKEFNEIGQCYFAADFQGFHPRKTFKEVFGCEWPSHIDMDDNVRGVELHQVVFKFETPE